MDYSDVQKLIDELTSITYVASHDWISSKNNIINVDFGQQMVVGDLTQIQQVAKNNHFELSTVGTNNNLKNSCLTLTFSWVEKQEKMMWE